MKRMIAVMAVVLAMVPAARADDASRQAKVVQLFAAMHMERLTDQTMAAVQAQMASVLSGMPGMDRMTPAQKEILAEMQTKTTAMVREAIGWKVLEPDMVKLYASTYSEEEIDGILAFYKSPVGQKMMDKTPELTTQSMKITQAKMVALQPQLMDLIKEYAKKLQDAGTAPAETPKAGGGAQ